jgi:hypothetical protein
MSFSQTLTRMFGIAALAGVVVAAGPAAAQSARYCNNTLVANSFYSNVIQASGGADVEYHGQFQNQDSKKRAMVATMLRIQTIGRFTLIRVIDRFELKSYEQKDINLLSVHTTNQGGSGAPTPAQVGSTIKFVCTYQ